MPRKRTTYTAEFKVQAVRMITDKRFSVAEVARRAGGSAQGLACNRPINTRPSTVKTPKHVPHPDRVRAEQGVWRWHTWPLDTNGRVVETSVPREVYFGKVLSPEEAALFAELVGVE